MLVGLFYSQARPEGRLPLVHDTQCSQDLILSRPFHVVNDDYLGQAFLCFQLQA